MTATEGGTRRRATARATHALAPAVLVAFALAALLAPVLSPDDALSVVAARGPQLAAPSAAYPFGTDEHGRSVLALTLAGARLSLLVGAAATAGAVAAGALVGVVTGALPRPWAAPLLWVTDWFLVLPQVPVAVALAAVLRPGTVALVLAITLTSWAPVARVLRAAVLAARSQPYVERVRALGAGTGHVVRAHLLPHLLPVIAVNAALLFANALLAEATFSFLGLGVPTQVSWGGMLRSAGRSGALTAGAWWYLLAPGLAIVAVVLAAGAAAGVLRGAPARDA